MSTPRTIHRVVNKTAAYSIESRRDRSGTIFTNRGATGSVTITLPPPNRCQGWSYLFIAVVAQTFLVATRTADTLIGLADATADSLSVGAIGGVMRVVCDGTSWIAWTESVGTTGTVAT